MAEQPQKAPSSKVTLHNIGRGQQVIIDSNGEQHIIGPGTDREVELFDAQIERYKVASKAGSPLQVAGSEYEEKKDPDAVEEPEEHKSRTALAEKETELMQAGQESAKEYREKMAAMSPADRVARTGINTLYHGPDALETVAQAPDSPAKPKKK